MPDPDLILSFFAGCALMALCFGVAEYRRKRKMDQWLKWSSSLPALKDDEHWQSRRIQ